MNQRSSEKELLDLGSDFYTPEEYEHCMKMLFRVNKLFGFFSSTVRTLRKFPKNSSVLDVGCGGGLFLLHLSQYFPNMQLVGSDISSEAIDVANQELTVWEKTYSTDNVSFKLQSLELSENTVDIVLTTLVCHHLNDEEIIKFLQQNLRCARNAVIINDLHRHSLAHWFYGLISPILFRNRLITHDGLISIRRGFKRVEWRLLLQKAGINHYQIKWCFPFRWRVILWKK